MYMYEEELEISDDISINMWKRISPQNHHLKISSQILAIKSSKYYTRNVISLFIIF